MSDRTRRCGTLIALAFSALSVLAWEGPKLTVEPKASAVRRTWADVKSAVADSIAHTGDGYFCYSRKFNDLGPIDTSGTLSSDELKTQFALACVLASPIAVNGPAPEAVAAWLADKALMNVNRDYVARQGHVVVERDGVIVIKKYLWDMNAANAAVAFYNPTDAAKTVTVDARELEYTGPVTWTDRFNPSDKGSFAVSFTVTLAPHATRLYHTNGKSVMRCVYRAECARTVADGRVFECVYVPKTGAYRLLVETSGTRPVAVNVNGLVAGTVRGTTDLGVTLWAPENRILLTGEGATDVTAIRVYDALSPLSEIVLALRLARSGRDGASAEAVQRAVALKATVEPAQTADDEMRFALVWIHDVMWEWEFDWLRSRILKAEGKLSEALEAVGEKGCLRFKKYGVEPKDPAFDAYVSELRKSVPKSAATALAADAPKPPAPQGMSAVAWQNTNEVALAAATAPDELDRVLASPEEVRRLLSAVKGAYETEALVASKIAAVTSRAMMSGHVAQRRLWTEALLAAATSSDDAYRTLFFLDQLRWCGFADQAKRIDGLKRRSK